jgi:hypothetical protein
MNNMQLKAEVIKILKADARLADMWARDPSAMYIPYKGNRDNFFVLVSLSLRDGTKSLDDLAYASLSTVRLLFIAGILGGAPAVEVVPYIVHEESTTRVLRLSVEQASLEGALRIEAKDLLKYQPIEGVRCEWYVQKPPVPSD